MSIVVCVCVRRWDLDSTNRCIANAKWAEVLFSVVLALHAGHKAGQRSGVGRRERWWQVRIRRHLRCECGRYCVVRRVCGVWH